MGLHLSFFPIALECYCHHCVTNLLVAKGILEPFERACFSFLPWVLQGWRRGGSNSWSALLDMWGKMGSFSQNYV